ncbi:DUF1659 domain-containing protein [Clostridium aciditolerans]|uniref:DUF1659 domain-containing protein n=1 Tax=Clostridium aciditolerans TaxID=339861 RepID=A0A934HXS6_9CLOT|nr:DUF1659 domain-containing protein [Clostridium aciditolerans]MBI6872723.1 DUF1659 domain-containing protein [Clostridium aciditolerans]
MAATATKLNSTLVIKYKDGVDQKGKEIIRNQRFSKVKPTATEQALYDTALEIEKLLGKTLDEVLREDQSGIMNA